MLQRVISRSLRTPGLMGAPRRWGAVSGRATLAKAAVVRGYATNDKGSETEFTQLDMDALPELAGNATQLVETAVPFDGYFATTEPYATTELFMTAFSSIHEVTGLPWWLTIATFTVAMRSILLPVHISSLRNSDRLRKIQPQVQALTKRMKEAKTKDDKTKEQRALAVLFEKHGVNPLKNFLAPLLQVPIFITSFSALRRLVLKFPEDFSVGGVLWFSDLCVSDPMYRLPLLNAALFLASFRLTAATMSAQQRKIMGGFMVFMTAFMVYVSTSFPGALHVYWLSTTGFSLGFAVVSRNASFRNLLGIPEPPASPLKKRTRTIKKKDAVRFFEESKNKK